MKRIFTFTLVSIILFLQSCKKDRTTEEPEDFTSFLASREHAFYGKISDSTVSWIYGQHFQLSYYSGITTVGGQPEKILAFYLISNDNPGPRLYISIPKYTVGTEELFTKVVSPGDKIIGPQFDKFFFRLTLNAIDYTTNGDQTGSHLKVLKMEKEKDGIGRDIVLVWISINCKFFNQAGNYAFSVQKGKLLAGFAYNL